MRLWKRASGAIKDQNSLILARLSRRTEFRNPDIVAAVIKATSHDASRIDYRNAQCVFAWARLSSMHFRPILWAISARMNKTHDWVVALKGLLLLHGVFCCKVPAAQWVGRLPFDLSSFKDKHSHPGKTWGYNAFVRAYYAFIDQKAAFTWHHMNEARVRRKKGDDEGEKGNEKLLLLRQDLVRIQGLQEMLDMLLNIRPEQDGMERALILEVMDCIMIEIFDVYEQICTGLAGVLLNIYSSWIGKAEASMALGVLQKANVQGEDLALYCEFCRDIGVSNAVDCPKLVRFSDENIQELEQILNGVSKIKASIEEKAPLIKKRESKTLIKKRESKMEKGRDQKHERKDSTSSLKTVITDQWEIFEEEPKKGAMEGHNGHLGMVMNNGSGSPFVECLATPNELPDLISFI